MHKLTLLCCFTLLLTLAPIAVPKAEAAAGQANFEIFVGEYFSDSPIDEEPVIGVRGGYRFSDRFALQGSLSRVELVHPVISALGFDDNAIFFDVSAMWYVNPGRKAEVVLYGGPGVVGYEYGAQFDSRDHTDGYRFRERQDSEESATLHAGAGVAIHLNDRIYLRPDVRARWYEGYSSRDGFERSDTDFEATFAVGWKFGKP